MQFADYTPLASPLPADQQDALQKGLGRAVQWALAGKLADEALLAACLRDGRYDTQVDDARGDWLWSIVGAAGAAGRLRVPLLHALYDLPDERTAVQLCQLARQYAAAGDDAFRERLYAIVEQRPFEDRDLLGENDLIKLDGERGFLFAARLRGQELANRDWEWDDDMLADNAVERLGMERVGDLLDSAADEETRRFARGWRSQAQLARDPNPRQAHIDRMRAIGVETILAEAESEDGGVQHLRGWGRHADEADLEIVLDRLWAARDPRVIAKLLQVFSNCALPRFDERLIPLCRHEDYDVGRRASSVLAMNAHPLVREFALDELATAPPDSSVVALFIRNYLPGDEHLLLDAIKFPDDRDEFHWLLMKCNDLLEAHPAADCSRLGVLVYAETPCGNCRFTAARLLHARGAAPAWLLQECRHDAEADCREFAS